MSTARKTKEALDIVTTPRSRVFKASKRLSTANERDARKRIENEEELIKRELIHSTNDVTGGAALTGTVYGIRASIPNEKDSLAIILVQYKGETILIPADKFFPTEIEESLKAKGKLTNYSISEVSKLIGKRTNAEVDFCVEEIIKDDDGKIKYVTGNRVKAMEYKKHKFWEAVNKDKDGNVVDYHIHKGTEVTDARIVSSTNKGLLVEVQGVEQWMPREVIESYKTEDIRSKYKTGGTIPIKILEVIRKEKKGGMHITFRADHRPYRTNSEDKYFSRICVGDEILGRSEVTGVITTGEKLKFFVKIDGVIDCLCSMANNQIYLPKVGDFVDLEIIGKDETSKRIWGHIFHIRTDLNSI